jgi:hypothetical protein
MRITIGLLLAAIVALSLTAPARAETIPYAKIETSTVRLDEVLQDSKQICWESMAQSRMNMGDYIEAQGKRRDYNQRDIILLLMFCESYREGAADGIKAANQARISRS